MSSSQTNPNPNATVDIFAQYEHAKLNSGRFIKLAPGERKTLQFNLSKIAIVDSEYQGQKTGGKSIEFTVLDTKEPQSERVLSMSVRKAEGIMALLKAGKMLLDIQKIGTGKDSQFVAIPL